MKQIRYPKEETWPDLINRPEIRQEKLFPLVEEIFDEVRKTGDTAVRKYTQQFDGVNTGSPLIDPETLGQSTTMLDPKLKEAIEIAAKNINTFHSAQSLDKEHIETTEGVYCWRESRPIERVGIYIPGGTAPLFSTVLMLGIPAQIAGCREVVLCTPPGPEGNIHPAILYAARICNIKTIYRAGGIQAIGALTFGTETIPRVDKIFGPGNQYVTAAKQTAQNYGVAIDMPAGPSEVLVLADRTADPSFVASDLLAQAEHGTDSQVILVTDSDELLRSTERELKDQIRLLPRQEIAEKALENSKMILFESLKEGIQFSNRYAPEHLIVATDHPRSFIPDIKNAGSVFIGHYSCESAGDYASGTNHTLPTNGYARNYSGVSLESFQKQITFQEVTSHGLKTLGPAIETMAEAEKLEAHKQAVTIRLNKLRHV